MMKSGMTPPAARGDEELVNASLGGDREAFGQIVTRHQALVCSLAYSATGSLTQSEDLAQETFIAAWKHLAQLREPAKLRSWLCGIARNLIHNSLRTQGREPSHRAQALEDIAEPRSPEPLPAERAISREEAEILWRALERIPETYREPLVLFYREHQSVEAVAQELELTEEAVRQRLARGRKLLQEEVLAFVEGALEKTAPGTAFTVAVVAALPLAVTSAKAASIGVAAAKGGAGAKSAFSLAALGSLAAMLGAILFSWKTAVDETKSPPERRLMVRTAWFQIAFFVLSMGAVFYCLPRLSQHPLALGIGMALLLIANMVNGVVLMDHLGRRRTEIMMEEGAWADADWSGPGKETDRKALRKTVKLMIPFLLMFGVGSIGLPWKHHWIRCAAVVAAEGLFLLWAFRRLLQELRALAQAHPEDGAVREILAKGLFNTLNYAKAENDLSRRDALLQELRSLAQANPADGAVREQLAKGLVNTLIDAKVENNLSRCDALLQELRSLAEAYPEDGWVKQLPPTTEK